MTPTRILLADDYPFIRAGIRSILADEAEFLVDGEASDGPDLQELCQQVKPDIVLMDVSMPGASARENVQFLMQHFPQMKILALMEKTDQDNLYALLELGVDGYLFKDDAPETLIRALRSIALGDPWISKQVLSIILKKRNSLSLRPEKGNKSTSSLSSRELEVLQLLGKGLSNGQIADRLGLAERTIRHHIEKILEKLDAPNRTRAALIAIQNGWIDT